MAVTAATAALSRRRLAQPAVVLLAVVFAAAGRAVLAETNSTGTIVSQVGSGLSSPDPSQGNDSSTSSGSSSSTSSDPSTISTTAADNVTQNATTTSTMDSNTEANSSSATGMGGATENGTTESNPTADAITASSPSSGVTSVPPTTTTSTLISSSTSSSSSSIAAATTTAVGSTTSHAGGFNGTSEAAPSEETDAVIWIVVAAGAAIVLIIVTVVIIVIWRKKQAEQPVKRVFSPEQTPLTFIDSPNSDDPPRDDVDGDTIYMNTNIRSRRIPLNELGAFLLEHTETIKQECKDLPSGDLYPCTVAKKAENKGLNRFQNIHPYDRTRVVLPTGSPGNDVDDDDDDDSAHYGHGGGYINASYIDGYSHKRRYIATQGPLTKTIADFWSMIWSESCTSIVMLTSFVEEGKRKCEEYYPRDNRPVTYGAVTVELASLTSVSDYDLRSLKLVKAGQSRIVHHFHYLSWPDHGVPSCYAPFLLFRHKVLAFAVEASGPIVVHCSAGIGRTGAYIAVDYLLEEALDRGSVDVFAAVSQLRNQRPNMVQNQDQYQFIYGAVVSGALTGGFTLLPSNVAAHYFKLNSPAEAFDGKTALAYEFELVCSASAAPLPESDVAGSLAPENAHKNRDNSVPALEAYRTFLAPMTAGDGDYINAVFCNSFRRKNEFIATQVPMSHTADDFWRLLLDHDCETIILVHEVEPKNQYWPAAGRTVDTPRFAVTALSEWTDPEALYTVRDFEIKAHKDPESFKRVRQCQLHFWPSGSKVPSSAQAMLAFTDAMNGWRSSSDGRCTVVQCMNGADHSGLFIAALNVLERLKEDQEVDIFHTVEMIKIFRPQFVSSEAQYIFLYILASALCESSDVYSNFTGL